MGDYLNSDESRGDKENLLLRKQKELEFQKKLSQEELPQEKHPKRKEITRSSWFIAILIVLFLCLLAFLIFK
jgi:hypothetical protein